MTELEQLRQENGALSNEVEFLTKKMIQINSRLENAESSKALFISLVQNVFNNPLAVLLSMSRRLKNEKEISKANNYGKIIHGELLSLNFYLQNIFEAGNIENGKIDCHFSKIDPLSVAEDMLGHFIPIREEKKLEVDIVDDCHMLIVTDSQKYGIIMRNLISNALEYAYPETCVQIRIALEGESLVCHVINQGDPIRVAHKEEVYNRFQKNSNAHRFSQGLGLGLSIVHAYVDVLGGTIDYECQDSTTTFTLKIPSKPAENEAFDDDELFFDGFGDVKEY